MYDVIGDGSAPSFFSVGNNGRIFTRGNLRSDNTLTYTVSFTKLMLLFNYTKTTFKFGETNSYHFVWVLRQKDFSCCFKILLHLL